MGLEERGQRPTLSQAEWQKIHLINASELFDGIQLELKTDDSQALAQRHREVLALIALRHGINDFDKALTSAPPTQSIQEPVSYGRFTLHLEDNQLSTPYHPKLVTLTPTESRVLHILFLNAPRVVRAGRIEEFVWNYEEGSQESLRVHVSNMRRKIEITRNFRESHIQALQGVGYSFRDPIAA